MENTDKITDQNAGGRETGLPQSENPKNTVYSLSGSPKTIDETNFSKIVFEEAPLLQKPQIDVSLFASALDTQRILIISGRILDKISVARHCAWQKAQLETDLSESGEIVHALHYRASSDTEDVFQHIESKQTPSVFVITNIDPSNFSKNRDRLQEAVKGRHWVIFTTDRPREAWHISEETEALWFDASDTPLYFLGDITRFLERELTPDAAQKLPFKKDTAQFETLASQLGAPTAVESLVRQLEREDREISTARLDELVRAAKNEKESVELWFRYALDDREKSIAIALSLFSGVDEDLVFLAIDSLMEEAWRKRDSALLFVDYSDLEALMQYFTFDLDENGIRRLRTVGEDTDSIILNSAWPTHRRQIIAALPVMINLVLESVDDRSLSFGLHQSDDRLEFLRETIGISLGEIGLQSLETIEGHLLKLVATGKINAIKTVSTALRRIRHRSDERINIFPMLERWKRHSDLHRWLQIGAGGDNSSDVEETINLAIAYMLGKLALEDPPNLISDDIVNMVMSYTKSNDTGIINVLSLHSLPALIIFHGKQMSEKFDDLMTNTLTASPEANRNVCLGMGYGLSLASRVDDPTLLDIMLDWKRTGLENARRGVDIKSISLREKRLSTVCYALGFTEKRASNNHATSSDRFTPVNAMQHLADILKEESHPFVRRSARLAIQQLIENEFSSVKDSLYKPLEQMKEDEHQELIDALVTLHRKQREAQRGGDAYIMIGDYHYPIWYDREPENTEVLQAFFDWSGSKETSAELAQFASASVNTVLHATENAETEKTKELREHRKEEQKRRDKISQETIAEVDKKKVRLGFLQRKAVGIVSSGKTSRGAIEGILETIIPLSETKRDELIERYKRQGGDAAVNAEAARKAYKLSRKLPGWIGLGVVLALILGAVAIGMNS